MTTTSTTMRPTTVEASHVPPPLIVAASTLLGLGLDHVLGTSIARLSRFRPLGVVAQLSAGALFGSAVFTMMRAGNSPDPRSPVHTLNTRGIYRVSRNPIYLGMILGQLGIGLKRKSLATIMLTQITLAILSSKVIAVEEAYLESAFGDEYRAYRARVSRWLGFRRA